MDVKIFNNSINELPTYANPGDAGMDLRADFSKGVNTDLGDFSDFDEERGVYMIWPGGRALIPTNYHTAIPEGYEAQIRPRSGLALKNGISVLNTPGTIDMGYRAGWGVIVVNLGDSIFEVNQGDRIAQVVFNKFEKVNWIPVNTVEELEDSVRGNSGFGDSGVK